MDLPRFPPPFLQCHESEQSLCLNGLRKYARTFRRFLANQVVTAGEGKNWPRTSLCHGGAPDIIHSKELCQFLVPSFVKVRICRSILAGISFN